MSRIAVKLYRDTLNEDGCPEEWPAETLEIDESVVELPPGFTLNLSRTQYDEYVRARQNVYDEWLLRGTKTEREERVMRAFKNAWKFIESDDYGGHDQGGLLKFARWINDPTTPAKARDMILAIENWTNVVMFYYLQVWKPQILAGEYLPCIDSPDPYWIAGPPPYKFTEVLMAMSGA